MKKIEGHSFNPDLLSSNSIVIDVGGNGGNFSWEIKKEFNCTIECFEPDLIAYGVMCDRIKRNPKFIPHNKAVSGDSGRKPFYRACPCNGGNSLLPDSDEYKRFPGATTIEVDVVSMDSILERYPIVDLVKLDCEGAEISIIKNSKNLKKIKQLTVEFHDFCIPSISENDIK
jgi:FkbM family methyltransferase